MTRTTSRMRSLERRVVKVSLETSLHLGRLLESLERNMSGFYATSTLPEWCFVWLVLGPTDLGFMFNIAWTTRFTIRVSGSIDRHLAHCGSFFCSWVVSLI